MNRLVIADSACLIALEQIHELPLLGKLFDEVLIPPAVMAEFGGSALWLRVIAPTNAVAVDSLKLIVDEGEAEAIALAAELALPVILDDRQARRVALGMRLSMFGTIGCLLQAKQRGFVTAIKPVIEKLESVGFYLSTELKASALKLAGE